MASVQCGDITITVAGEAAKCRSSCAGVYKPTGEMSSGRQLFRNHLTGKYLGVVPGCVSWGVRANIDSRAAGILSGCSPGLCPATPRAAYNARLNKKHWQYAKRKGGGWHDSEDIVVKCSKHSGQ